MRSFVAVVCCLLVTGASVSAQFCVDFPRSVGDEESPFNVAALEVYRAELARDTTREKLEEEYLSLLEVATSPEEQGLVYAHIVWLYSSNGTNPQPNVVETYCQEALTHPLPVDVAALMYSRWSSALSRRYMQDWRGSRHSVARRRIIAPVLDGLKLVLDNGAPKERVELPAVGKYNIAAPPDSPALQRARQRHAEQMAARQTAERLDSLKFYRGIFVQQCINLYLREPADPDELTRLATEALADHPEALQDLLDQLAAAVAENE